MHYEHFIIELDGIEETIKGLTYDPYIRSYLKYLKIYYMNKNYEMLNFIVVKILKWFDSQLIKESLGSICNQNPYNKTKEILKQILSETKNIISSTNRGS
jgi:hypothetical protein